MFRYAETFHGHPFHNAWNILKKRISEIDHEKIDDIDRVAEFERLNKCIEYIDAYLKIIDPDFLTDQNISALDEINGHAMHLTTNIEDYKETDYQPQHISDANNSVSHILHILNNFHTIQPAVSEESISSPQINLPLVKKESDQIHLLKQQLIDGKDGQESIKLQIENLFEDFKNKQGTTSDSIKTNQEFLEQYKKDATDKTNELTNKIDEFNKFYITVFGEQDSETDTRIGGLKAELEDRVQELDKFRESQETEYSTLTEEIRSLLPGATSTGLASAYNDERKKFEKPLKKWNWIFIGSLSAMIAVTIGGFFFNSTGAESVIMEHLNGWLLRLPFYLPLIWLAIYASKRRSELYRLDQEYAHKEASAKSYSSYKDQIDNLNEDNDTLSSKLLDSIIDSTSRNPSETLGKHSNDTPVGEVTKKIVDEENKQ